MDYPGPSSSTNNVVRPISVYYGTPPSPPTIQTPIAPFSTIPGFNSLLYPQFSQQQGVQYIKTEYLNRSGSSAFKEVNDLRTAINYMLPFVSVYGQLPNGLGAAGLTTTQSAISTALSQSLLRKRPAASTPTAQPEGPVSARTVINPSNLPAALLLNQCQWMFPMRAPSPTIPTGNIGMSIPPENQLPIAEEPAVKWSSPSSVDSNGQKTDSSAVSANDSHNIDIVGDGSESSTSSSSAQDQIAQSLYNVVSQQAQLANVLKADNSLFFPSVSQPQADISLSALRVAPMPSSSNKPATGGPERKPRKPVNDDIVKIVRQQDLSPEAIAVIEIPVPKAVESDPTFRPVSEQQIIQQIIQGKKYEEMEVGECMIQLCKKLAEKRVFGPRLMSQTTVAGLNHSNYSNLPIKGICYIQHVCWKVLRDKFNHDEDFWDKFREAMRKLAARCRRVRHAKKTKHNREESLAQQELLAKRFGEDNMIKVSLSQTLNNLGLRGLRPKADGGYDLIPLSNSDGNNFSVSDFGLVFKKMSEQNSMSTLTEQDSSVVESLLKLANSDFKVKNEQVSPL